jgi:hypothetical protein
VTSIGGRVNNNVLLKQFKDEDEDSEMKDEKEEEESKHQLVIEME